MTISKPEDKSDTSYGDYWSGKKPYLVQDYRKMMQKKTQEEYYFHELHYDPMSELYRPYLYPDEVEGFGWEYIAPPDVPWPGWDPPFIYPPGGECQLACNPSMLDCDGGCTQIACICPAGLLEGRVVFDPTGGLIQVAGYTHTSVIVCLMGDPGDLGQEYPSAVIAIFDGTTEVKVNVALVACLDCCDEMTLTGDDTVNPGSTWTGTISPSCGDLECSVVSNSGCSLSCNVLAGGAQVTVAVGANDCGSFTVTVTDVTDDSCVETASKTVRINNTGQGGAWVNIDFFAGVNTCRNDCGGDPMRTSTDGFTQNCIDGKYRVGAWNSAIGNMSCWCCYACDTGCSADDPHPDKCATICLDCPATDWCGECTGTYRGNYTTWGLWEWKCTC